MKIHLIVAFSLMSLVACAGYQPAGEKLPPTDGKEVWSYITQTNPYKSWGHWPGYDGIYPGKSPHGAYLKLYANPAALKAAREGKPMPDGAIIVKENYGKDKTTLMAVTPMYRVKGYNPEGGGTGSGVNMDLTVLCKPPANPKAVLNATVCRKPMTGCLPSQGKHSTLSVDRIALPQPEVCCDNSPSPVSLILVAGMLLALWCAMPSYAGDARTTSLNQRPIVALEPHYRASVLRGWRSFQTSYAQDGLACVHCHLGHDSLRPWAERMEIAVDTQLLTPIERGKGYTEHDLDQLQRGDMKTVMETQRIGRYAGIINADEARERIGGLNPIEDEEIGGRYWQPSNMDDAASDRAAGIVQIPEETSEPTGGGENEE